MNLLYKEYRKGCGNLILNDTVVNYYYGYPTSQASYYADLQPNTTYTLKRLDSSSRFRIATYDTDVKQCTASTTTTGAVPVQGWIKDSENELTFTTGANDIHLVVYYTNASEYATRVMLNEGSTAEEYEESTINMFPPASQETTISEFEQGGFNTSNGNFTTSTTEIRSGLYRINPCKISIDCDSGLTWTFVCYDSDFSFTQITESSTFRSSGEVVDLSSYTWIRYIRVELHNSNNISPPAECTMNLVYPFIVNDNDEIIVTSAPDAPDTPFVTPYPKNLWRISNGQIYHELYPEPQLLGAFANCRNLNTVVIPETVKSIGEYAFRNTQLTSVTIASDCTYYPTSFPDGCVINFYSD